MSVNVPTPESFKEKAKIVRSFMKEKSNSDISHSHSLELVSRLFGFKDWNTASAISKSKGRLPTYIKTVGQMKKVLEKFDDSAAIEMWNLETIEGFLEVIHMLKLKDEMFQNRYSLIFEGVDSEKASFQLKLENQKMLDADGKEIRNEWRNTGICDL